MTTITVQSPRNVATPRGAVLGAWVFQSLTRFVERLGEIRRERAERRAFAYRISDAAAVRRYAQSVIQYDARFAADLFAAADRHEMFDK
jgi:hypothetical protein